MDDAADNAPAGRAFTGPGADDPRIELMLFITP
jgi:hypothetical protein